MEDYKEKKFTARAFDITLRMLLVFGLIFWCFEIISPFIMPVLWALIIAVAVNPVQEIFEQKLKIKSAWAASIITVLLLSLVLVPAIAFINSVVQVIIEWKREFEQGNFTPFVVPEFIKQLPIIGNKLNELLTELTSHLDLFINKYQSQVIDFSKGAAELIIGSSLGLLKIIFAIILAGFFLAMGNRNNVSSEISNRIIGADGPTYIHLSVQTIRKVVKGILGVAFIQSLLAGIGFYLANIPHAAIWTLICFVLSIVQIGPVPILIGIVIFMFETNTFMFASIWTIYFIGVALLDGILKPILLGKGAPVPMLVIFLGVLGGFMLSGFFGLFTGAIILSIGYKLFMYWLESGKNQTPIEKTDL